jgi:hypothetical protein
MARAAQSQANSLQGTAGTTAATNQSNANAAYAPLNSFLTQELQHPQGYSQAQTTSMLSAAQGGAGGANAGITGQANLQAARTRNSGGFSSALDAAARSRGQQNASASEGIAANSANLAQQNQQAGAKGMQGLYDTDSSNALQALGVQNNAINSEVNASNSGWLQNATGILGDLSKGASGLGSMGIGFGKGQIWGSN